jgi:acetyl esterase
LARIAAAGQKPVRTCSSRRLHRLVDPLGDEGTAYAKALQAADVPTTHHEGFGLIPGYFGLGEASDTAKAEAQRARADFKVLLERGA